MPLFNPVMLATAGTLTQTYSTADATHVAATQTAVATTGATNVTPFGFTTSAQANDIVTQLNNARTDILEVKQFCNSIADIVQATGAAA